MTTMNELLLTAETCEHDDMAADDDLLILSGTSEWPKYYVSIERSLEKGLFRLYPSYEAGISEHVRPPGRTWGYTHGGRYVGTVYARSCCLWNPMREKSQMKAERRLIRKVEKKIDEARRKRGFEKGWKFLAS